LEAARADAKHGHTARHAKHARATQITTSVFKRKGAQGSRLVAARVIETFDYFFGKFHFTTSGYAYKSVFIEIVRNSTYFTDDKKRKNARRTWKEKSI